MITLCLLILIFSILGKDIKPLLAKLKNTDWKAKGAELFDKIKPYALRIGRAAAEPLLQLYFVLTSEETSLKDKALIYAALIYIISPADLLPAEIFKWLGILDDGAAGLFVYSKVKDLISRDINIKVNDTLDAWFGVQHREFDY